MASDQEGFNFIDTPTVTWTTTPDGTVSGLLDVSAVSTPIPTTMYIPLFDNPDGTAVINSDGSIVLTLVPAP